MKTTIDNSKDILDSRDVIARREELESELQALIDALTDEDQDETDKELNHEALADWLGVSASELDRDVAEGFTICDEDLQEWGRSDEAEELRVLIALCDEGESASDWTYGETMIRESYFETYAEELAGDLGMMDRKDSGQWPYNCIDWERAARELKQDYSEIDFDGVTYLIRA